MSWDALNVIANGGSDGCNREAKESEFNNSKNRIYWKIIVFSVKLASARKKLDFGSILQEINAVVAIFYDTWFVRRIERDRGG